MNGRVAGLLFLGLCLVLAVLLLLGTISPIVSGLVFAVALVILGGASRGFTKRSGDGDERGSKASQQDKD